MPCFNAAPWIGAARRSVAAQTLASHEIIVIDDDSTDDSLAQIRDSGVCVRLLHCKRGGAGAARNVGIAAATGDWLALLDADDEWYPDHLRNAAALLDGSDDAAFMANHHLMNQRERGIELSFGMAPEIESPARGLAARRWLELFDRGFHFGHSTVIYRRARLEEVGAFDESFARIEDLDLWMRATRGQTWAYHSQPAALYRTDAPGSRSKAPWECEYFHLRALLDNRAGFEGAAWDNLTRASARRLLSLSMTDGTPAQWRRARVGLAAPAPRSARVFSRRAGRAPAIWRRNSGA